MFRVAGGHARRACRTARTARRFLIKPAAGGGACSHAVPPRGGYTGPVCSALGFFFVVERMAAAPGLADAGPGPRCGCAAAALPAFPAPPLYVRSSVHVHHCGPPPRHVNGCAASGEGANSVEDSHGCQETCERPLSPSTAAPSSPDSPARHLGQPECSVVRARSRTHFSPLLSGPSPGSQAGMTVTLVNHAKPTSGPGRRAVPPCRRGRMLNPSASSRDGLQQRKPLTHPPRPRPYSIRPMDSRQCTHDVAEDSRNDSLCTKVSFS